MLFTLISVVEVRVEKVLFSYPPIDVIPFVF